MNALAGSHDPYRPWQPEPATITVIELPRAQLDRLKARAVAAGCVNAAGQGELVEFLMHQCRMAAGCVCDAGLDEIAADTSDPDLQALLTAAVKAAMERDRPN